MSGGHKQLNSKTPASPPQQESESSTNDMNNPVETVKSGHSFSVLLEFAANNDVEGFKQSLTNSTMIDEVGLLNSRQMALKRMTPLMVAALYGSVEVVKLILSLSKADINRSCDPDNSTALHFAASGGSVEAIDVVKLLLRAGADPNATDSRGRRPFDVIVSHSNLPNVKVALKELLKRDGSIRQSGELYVSPNSTLSPSTHKKRQYRIDLSIPEIGSSIYATDEFRMYEFKIQPCSRSRSHDWMECPFLHPGETARRRDPRKFRYSLVSCYHHYYAPPCSRGDLCEFAHGIFEILLHPSQYRTRLCKDGTSCNRRVCCFAHTAEELRPVDSYTGSAVPSSPHSATSAGIAVGSAMSPSLSTPPMSPGNGISQAAWPQQNVPTLHLADSHLQMGRLRSSVNTREFQSDRFQVQQQRGLYDLSSFSANLNEIFPSQVLSPGYSDQFMASPIVSQSHRSAVSNQLYQQESMFSPAKTSAVSPKNFQHSLLQPSFQNNKPLTPSSSKVSAFANRENQQQQLPGFSSPKLGSNLSHDLGYNLWRNLGSTDFLSSPGSYWSTQWESPTGKLDWPVESEEPGRSHKSSSTGHNAKEPEVLLVQSPAKELRSDTREMTNSSASDATATVECSNPKQYT
ncbi:Zinc finger CCCH domain-containing protein 56 [Morus notabilis]|uniref:Zinc finger CCCH domain-containing protein 56 n=1 Tax=Morus notabilis TaxID=981085 RepID=W9RHW1_9ROSA|nr:zinc finger CCCH domain-containing protein 30 [Morus notabilis]EXB93305.1 Zinc finger CCCH domain-containing protein 56 [Morus notabilis]